MRLASVCLRSGPGDAMGRAPASTAWLPRVLGGPAGSGRPAGAGVEEIAITSGLPNN